MDVPTFGEMERIVDSVGDEVITYKVGHQLFTAEGPRVIRYLRQRDKNVFLDLKLHEIPNSVASAVRSAGNHGVDMITVHASGGRAMMAAGVEAASEFPGLTILALTVVTGLTDQDLTEIGIDASNDEQVNRLARLAESSGCHGVIASPAETKMLRDVLAAQSLIVTPGVRPAGTSANDQARVATPAEAVANGASYVIIGRPITQSEDPARTAREINEQIAIAFREQTD
jgi:orotidine-5'-phosphate decarboxylase